MIIKDTTYKARGHRGHDRMVVGFTTTVQSVPKLWKKLEKIEVNSKGKKKS
jgi:hypothetical protein